MPLKNYTVSRTFNPAEIIPAHTLAQLGDSKMAREFADWFGHRFSCDHRIDGWTVTVTARTDDAENVAIARLNKLLDTAADESMSVFE